jgi:hypothetical protein
MFKMKQHWNSLVRNGITVMCILLAACLLAGCASAATPTRDFPAAKTLPGWKAQEIQTYTPENLSTFVGTEAALYKAYGFDRADMQTFLGPKDLKITTQIFRMPDSASAYGLWTQLRKGKPVKIGVDGASDGSSELSFWQDRYVVRLQSNQIASPAQLEGLAKNAAAALPAGGQRPSLSERVPGKNQSPDGPIYFHDENTISQQLNLGGKNLLGLNGKMGSVIAFYTLDGKPATLLLVEYPDQQSLQNGLDALQNSGLPDLLVSGSKDNILGAVFGKSSAESASALLGEALK